MLSKKDNKFKVFEENKDTVKDGAQVKHADPVDENIEEEIKRITLRMPKTLHDDLEKIQKKRGFPTLTPLLVTILQNEVNKDKGVV